MAERQIEIKSEKFDPFTVLNAFYKIMQILNCLDFGFFEHRTLKERVIWKIVTVLHSVFLISLTVALAAMVDSDKSSNWSIVFLGNYFLNVLILISIGPSKTFCQLHRDLQIIDIKLRTNTAAFKLEKKLVTTNIFILSINAMVSIYYCSKRNFCLKPVLSNVIFIWVGISLYLVHTSCTFVFYSILCRLKYFSSVLKTKDRDILSMRNIYKEIADLTEMQKSALDPLLILGVISTTIGIMGNILLSLAVMNIEHHIGPRAEHLQALMSLVFMLAPAFTADSLARESNKVVLILHDKLIRERDSIRQSELERFIQYVEARPLRFRIYRVIPLDASLLGMVLNFAITYLIVIVQFAVK